MKPTYEELEARVKYLDDQLARSAIQVLHYETELVGKIKELEEHLFKCQGFLLDADNRNKEFEVIIEKQKKMIAALQKINEGL